VIRGPCSVGRAWGSSDPQRPGGNLRAAICTAQPTLPVARASFVTSAPWSGTLPAILSCFAISTTVNQTFRAEVDAVEAARHGPGERSRILVSQCFPSRSRPEISSRRAGRRPSLAASPARPGRSRAVARAAPQVGMLAQEQWFSAGAGSRPWWRLNSPARARKYAIVLALGGVLRRRGQAWPAVRQRKSRMVPSSQYRAASSSVPQPPPTCQTGRSGRAEVLAGRGPPAQSASAAASSNDPANTDSQRPEHCPPPEQRS